MSDIFKRYEGRGETGVPPSPYLAITTKGTTAISPVDIELLITSGYESIVHEIYGIGGFPSRTGYHPEKDLMREFGEFRHQITAKLDIISARLSDLEKKIESFSNIPKVVVIEEMSREEAKKKISECLNEIDEKIYPSEIAERLHIDYDLCVAIIEELLREGKIEIMEE